MKKLSLFQAIRGHVETLGPYFFRKVSLPPSEKVEIPTEDGDFLDAEIWKSDSKDWVVLTHGLEGSSKAAYIRAAAEHHFKLGINVIAWNFRACSGRLNLLPKLYHSGTYPDLKNVVDFLSAHYQPDSVKTIGFSLGGNLTLVFLASMGQAWLTEKKVESGMAISVPLNLAASSKKLECWHNLPYAFNFLRELKAKIHWKSSQYPEKFNLKNLEKCHSIWRFDDLFTAPLHGFANAQEYYRKCSSLYFITRIPIPVKITIAENDPMLARGNYPDLKNLNPLVSIEIRKNGGHCGFWGQSLF